MPERASKSQALQVGFESTYGTSVAATRKLMSLTMDADIQATRRKNFGQGYNFPSSTSMERDFTEGDIGGALMFDEVLVPLAMAFGTVTPTTGTPATVRKWVWTIPLTGDIIPKSVTMEKGDTNTAEKTTGVVATALEFGWTREEITIGGSILGQLTDVAAALTTAGPPTTYAKVPMNPNGVGIFMDTTSAGLGTTRMLRAFEGGISLGSLQSPIWPLNELNTSFDGVVSAQPESESTLLLMADTAGKALITGLRAGTRYFMRTYVKGPVIGAGPDTYLFQVDQAVEVVDVDTLEDSDGIYAIPLTLAPVADATWGKAMEITVTNTTTAL